jgi:hypothetical protein
VAHTIPADNIYSGEEAINTNEVLVVILVQKVLARNLNIVEPLKPKLAQVRAICFKVLIGRSTIKLLLKSIPPAPKPLNIREQIEAFVYKVCLKRDPDMSRENSLREASDVGFSRGWELRVLK